MCCGQTRQPTGPKPRTSCTTASIYASTFASGATVVPVTSDTSLNDALANLAGPTIIQLSPSQAAYQLSTSYSPLYDLCIEVRSTANG